MTTRLIIKYALLLLGTVLLSGCQHPPQSPPPSRETISFAHKFAEQRQPRVYHVDVLRGTPNPANCANQFEDRMRLDQVALTVQRFSYPSLINACHERFSLDVANARAISRHDAKFDFLPVPGSTNRRVEVTARIPVLGNTFPIPSRISIVTHEPVAEGVKATYGAAEIGFGPGGPVYRCQGSAGQNFWDEHILNDTTDTFFEFILTYYNPYSRALTAKFQCLARNMSDPSDKKLLLVMLGSISMTAEN